MKTSPSAIFACADLPRVPRAIELFCPYASRPWKKRDLEAIDYHSEAVPYLNVHGYVDFHANDPEDPRNWSRARTWYITAASVLVVLSGTMASSISAGCVRSIAAEFQVSEVAANLSTTLFQLGYCAGPFVFAPFSEFYGRRWLLYGTYACYMAFNFLCAFAPSFRAHAFGRLMAGTFVSAPLTVTPGILADLWPPFDRDNSVALLAVAVWAGPSLGPVVSAFLDQERGWRWAFYFVLWLGALGGLAVITIPETHPSTILAQKAQRHRDARIAGFENIRADAEANGPTLGQAYKTALLRPWVLLFDPISFLCCLYMAVLFTLQFMLFSIYPIVFEEIRGWTPAVALLPLLGAVVGPLLGGVIVVADTRRRKKAFDKPGGLEPEQHLVMAMVGGVGFAVTMFWFTWTGPYASIHWICPTLAGFFLSISLMLVFVAFLNYLVGTYVQYAASIVAVNTIARSLGAATAPLYTDIMFQAMGVQGGGSLIAGAATTLAVIPFVFFRRGRKIRDKSKYTTFTNGGQD